MPAISKYLSRFSGTTLVLLASLSWSATALLVKTVAVSSPLIPFLRSLLAGIILLPLFRPRELARTPQLAVMALTFPTMQLITSFSYRLTTAANASALYFSAPLWVFLYQTWRSRRLDRKALPAVALIVAGIVIILLEPNTGSNQFGNFIAAISGVLNAVFCLCLGTTDMSQRFNYVAFSAWSTALLTGLFNLAVQPEVFLEIPTYPVTTWLVLLIMALTQLVLPYFFFCEALQKISIQRVTILNESEFVFSPIWTLVLLQEIPTAYGCIGWLLILGGLLLNEIISMRKGKGQPQVEVN